MSAYSKFCDYIRDTLFNGSMKGGYVSFVIDDTYINDACKAIGVSKTSLFIEVRRFMLNSPHYTFSSHLVKSEQAHPLGDGKKPFTEGQK